LETKRAVVKLSISKRKIRFAEICTGYFNEPSLYIEFYVTDNFYKKFFTKKKEYSKSGVTGGNAYLFGNKFSLNSYINLGYVGNDAGQIGLYDATNGILESDIEKIKKYGSWGDLLGTSKNYSKKLDIVRKELNQNIIFVGWTHGGDVGASLYTHYDKYGEIDSLIIDVRYFYKE
jgi:hypothetical protein